MTYKVLELQAETKTEKLSTLASKGENLLQPSEFTDAGFALKLENLILQKDWSAEKSKGLTEQITQGTTAISAGLFWRGYKYFAQDDKVYVNDGTSNTLVHTYAGSGDTSFAKFSDYVFATNGSEKYIRISKTLVYKNGTIVVAVGDKIVGDSSGTSATVLEAPGTNPAGTLTIGFIKGDDGELSDFTDSEGLEVGGVKVSEANGTLTFVATIVTGAKICEKLFIFDERLVLAKLEDNPSQLLGSKQFNSLATTPNPPFTEFTQGTPVVVTDAFTLSYSNAGDVTDLVINNSQLVTFYTEGESGIRISSINDATDGLIQNVVKDFQNEAQLGALSTVKTRDGLYFVNDGGVWFSPITTETTQPFTITSNKISRLFSKEFTDSINFAGSKMILDETENRILITCKKDNSSFHNFLLIIYPELRTDGVTPVSRRTGWYISNFFQVGKEIWGTSSIEGKIFKLFDGNSDNGVSIRINFEQELTQGQIQRLQEMTHLSAKGFLSTGQTVTWTIDIYDKLGMKRTNFATRDWTLTGQESKASGIGAGGISQSGIGGSGKSSILKESWYQKRLGVYQFSRIIVKITEESQLPLKLIWYSLTTIDKGKNTNISQ